MSDTTHGCERCGKAVASFDRLVWRKHQPWDEDSTSWAVCWRCDDRLNCGCNARGCIWCGARVGRRERYRARRDRRRMYRVAGRRA